MRETMRTLVDMIFVLVLSVLTTGLIVLACSAADRRAAKTGAELLLEVANEVCERTDDAQRCLTKCELELAKRAAGGVVDAAGGE